MRTQLITCYSKIFISEKNTERYCLCFWSTIATENRVEFIIFLQFNIDVKIKYYITINKINNCINFEVNNYKKGVFVANMSHIRA